MGSQGADLFGLDPGTDPFAFYQPRGAGADLYGAAEPSVAAAWRAVLSGMLAHGQGDLSRMQAHIDRQVEEFGLAFRLTGDEHERPWPLGPVPILLGSGEWAAIEAGLVQRAELLEAVLADLYGPQDLVSGGQLPAPMVSGSPHFARRMVGLAPRRGYRLQIYAVDLARGPGGEWRVLADRVRLPVGIGYALENRQALARATGPLLASIGTRRQSDFFDALRGGIAAGSNRSDPRIALLTPGRFNQSYPEQANLARHLGFSLVEGRDLAVRDGRLFVRTIAGLKRIDALWRWINTRDIDPLSFDSRSQIGVPNLISACAAGNLAMVNWPGAGVVESRAMSAFLPRLCRTLRGETLLLPNAATWWCGGEKERAYVRDNLDRLVIGPAFRVPVPVLPDGSTRAGESLNADERAALLTWIDRRPMDYAAQEIVRLSSTPCLAGQRLEPRGFTIRAFLARDAAGRWAVLPGGLGRVSASGDLRTSLMGLGDHSCDVCIVDSSPSGQTVPPPRLDPPRLRREQGLLASQAADNLYWLGRYSERGHQVARAIRTLLEMASSAAPAPGGSTAIARLAALLLRWNAVPAIMTNRSPPELAAAAFGGQEQGASVARLNDRARQLGLLLRDRFGRDSRRVLNRPLPPYSPVDAESIAAAADMVIENHAAFIRLTADTMSRSPAWRFLDLGLCLERASLIVQAARTIVPGAASAEDLTALLELADAHAVYRSRYLAMPYIAPVLDMVLLDPLQPRSLIFQARNIVRNLESLPGLRDDGLADEPLRLARQFFARIEALEAEAIDPRLLDDLGSGIARLSDAIDQCYFLQGERPAPKDGGQFLS